MPDYSTIGVSASKDDDTNSLYLEGKVYSHYSTKHFEAFVSVLRSCVKGRDGRPGCERKVALNLNIGPLTTGGHRRLLSVSFFLRLVHFVEQRKPK